MCWEQYFAVGGALRHVEFDPTPGTLNCADFPGVGLDRAGAGDGDLALPGLQRALEDDLQRSRACAATSCASAAPASGRRPSSAASTSGASATATSWSTRSAARSARSRIADGISTGGQSRTPICKLPNVEHTEQTFPVLFLYRKEMTDSGGAGNWRGGLSAESCFIPHGTDGHHARHAFLGQRHPDLDRHDGRLSGRRERLPVSSATPTSRSGWRSVELVGDIAEVAGQTEELGLRQQNFLQNPADVYAVLWSAAGGFGDPLERDPERVWRDVVENRAVSRDAAAEIYGVVMTDDERLDAKATDAASGGAPRRALPQGRRDQDSGRQSGRAHLRQPGGSQGERRPAHLLREVRRRSRPGPGQLQGRTASARTRRSRSRTRNVGDWRRYIDERPVFRQFFCPGCGGIDRERDRARRRRGAARHRARLEVTRVPGPTRGD